MRREIPRGVPLSKMRVENLRGTSPAYVARYETTTMGDSEVREPNVDNTMTIVVVLYRLSKAVEANDTRTALSGDAHGSFPTNTEWRFSRWSPKRRDGVVLLEARVLWDNRQGVSNCGSSDPGQPRQMRSPLYPNDLQCLLRLEWIPDSE